MNERSLELVFLFSDARQLTFQLHQKTPRCYLHRNMVLEGSQESLFFFRFYRNFLQEFLCRNSCIYSGFLGNPEDSSRFLFPPIAVWLGQRLKKALCYYTFQID